MADSDNSTSLPSVTRAGAHAGIAPVIAVGQGGSRVIADPAADLSLKWTEAHAKAQVLCIYQQELETRLLAENAELPSANELADDYAAALEAERAAAAVEQALLASLTTTPAQTIEGIVGKLTMILGECEDNSDVPDFPGPHIRSVLDDLTRMAGQGSFVSETSSGEARGLKRPSGDRD